MYETSAFNFVNQPLTHCLQHFRCTRGKLQTTSSNNLTAISPEIAKTEKSTFFFLTETKL